MQYSNLTFLIVDDHVIIRQGVSFIINSLVASAKIIEANSFLSINEICSNNKIDVLILDLNFPDGNSINIIPQLKINYPNIKILIFTAHDESYYAVRCINSGANGYLSKTAHEDEIKQAVLSIIETGKYISQKIKDIYVDSNTLRVPINPIQFLTNKEIEIALLYIKGLGNLEISNKLDIKKSTVSTFKSRVFNKLNIDNIPQLIQIFNSHYNNK